MNGSDVTKCILNEKLIKPKVPTLADEHMAHKKRVWEYRMSELIKTERVLEGNVCNLFMVAMSLCETDTKNQVESTEEYPDL